MSRKIAIVDYGSGNLRSAFRAFSYIASTTDQVILTANPADLNTASHIVLPGVGAFADCMRGLRALNGMIEALEEIVRQKQRPFLGICVGMQLLARRGHEHGITEGLGWLDAEVVEMAPGSLKIPHMGWNNLEMNQKDHPLLTNLENHCHVYFVHSYHMECRHSTDVIATTDYGTPLTAIVAQGNIMGTQFHPEKSQRVGLQLLKNFVGM